MISTRRLLDPLFAAVLRWATQHHGGSMERSKPTSSDLPALVARAIGLQSQAAGKDAAWNWSDEPFGSGFVGAFTGGLALKVARADVLPQLTVRQFNAALRLANNELSLDDVTGDMAGGRLSGRILFRSADDGLTSQLKVSLVGR